jgi:hypothetical protein
MFITQIDKILYLSSINNITEKNNIHINNNNNNNNKIKEIIIDFRLKTFIKYMHFTIKILKYLDYK